MGAALSLCECRQCALLVGVVCSIVVGVLRFLVIQNAPSRVVYLLAADLKVNVLNLAHNRGCGELAVGIEHADEAAGYQVVDVTLEVGEVRSRNAGGDDGVVVGYLRRVEHLLALWQLGVCKRKREGFIAPEPLESGGTLGIDVVAEILSVHTGIRGELLLVERLYGVERQFGAHGELLVAVYLQRRKVVEMRGSLFAGFLLHVGYDKGLACYLVERLLAFFLAGKLARSGREQRVAVYR